MITEQENLQELTARVESHANKMRTPANNERGKCVDGGYHADEAEGAVALPGGHVGLVMNLIAMGYSAEEAFGMTKEFLREEGIVFGWHSDTHEGHSCTVGCGHWNAAMEHPEEYVAAEKREDEAELQRYKTEVEKLFELLTELRAKQAEAEGLDEEEIAELEEVECIVLTREHAEQAILVVTSEDFTVKPWDENEDKDLDVQFFIYDKARHQKLLDGLAAKLGFDEEQKSRLMAISEQQTNATLGLLGSSKGKPIYTVDVSVEGKAKVEFAAYAPVIEK